MFPEYFPFETVIDTFEVDIQGFQEGVALHHNSMDGARLVQELATLIRPVAACVQQPVGLSLPPSYLLFCQNI